MTVMPQALLKITSPGELVVREPLPSATESWPGLPLSALSCRHGLRRACGATKGWVRLFPVKPAVRGPGKTIPQQV
jgi:hypothetical protein